MLGSSRTFIVLKGLLVALTLAIAASTPVVGHGTVPGAGTYNLADLISQSQRILLGRVEVVTDGLIDDSIPYTEIKLSVAEVIKGPETQYYQFRQFGKHLKRGDKVLEDFPTGSVQGFPQWYEGEHVLIFLPQPARITGMQTTVGLIQGKLIESNGRFESGSGIEGIFENLVVEAGDLTREQIDMLKGGERTVNITPLLDLLRRAVDESWVEHGVMHREE